jgi:hypothetical protein
LYTKNISLGAVQVDLLDDMVNLKSSVQADESSGVMGSVYSKMVSTFDVETILL